MGRQALPLLPLPMWPWPSPGGCRRLNPWQVPRPGAGERHIPGGRVQPAKAGTNSRGVAPRPVIQASVAPRERQDAFQGGQDRGPTVSPPSARAGEKEHRGDTGRAPGRGIDLDSTTVERARGLRDGGRVGHDVLGAVRSVPPLLKSSGTFTTRGLKRLPALIRPVVAPLFKLEVRRAKPLSSYPPEGCSVVAPGRFNRSRPGRRLCRGSRWRFKATTSFG